MLMEGVDVAGPYPEARYRKLFTPSISARGVDQRSPVSTKPDGPGRPQSGW